MNTCGMIINFGWRGKGGSVRPEREMAIVGSIDAEKAVDRLMEDLHEEGKQEVWTEIKGAS